MQARHSIFFSFKGRVNCLLHNIIIRIMVLSFSSRCRQMLFLPKNNKILGIIVQENGCHFVQKCQGKVTCFHREIFYTFLCESDDSQDVNSATRLKSCQFFVCDNYKVFMYGFISQWDFKRRNTGRMGFYFSYFLDVGNNV